MTIHVEELAEMEGRRNNENYNICPEANGCENAKNPEIFYSFCLENYKNCKENK